MAMFKRLKGLKESYEASRAEEKEIRNKEKKLLKDYNLKKTNQPGRYIAGDKVIDVNVRNTSSITAARDVLQKRDLNPTLKQVSKKDLENYSEGVGISGKFAKFGKGFQNMSEGSNIGNIDLIGNVGGGSNMDLFGGSGGGIGNYDFFGGGTQKTKPKKRRKTTTTKRRQRR